MVVTEDPAPARRRRHGKELEAALLTAGWDELVEAGYARLTMGSVAARARNSEPVLYRRWAGKDQLVLAAIEHHRKANPVAVPDTGTLRGDLIAQLTAMSESLAGFFAITGTLAFYGALVAGPVSLGTPIVGTVESAVPVIGAVLLGHRMTGATWLAIVLAVLGGALVSLRLGSGERLTARAALLAVTGGVLFGASILALSRAPQGAGLVPAVLEGGIGFIVMSLLLGAARASSPLDRLLRLFDAETDASPEHGGDGAASRAGALRRYLPVLVTGVLLGLGNTLLVVALRIGELAIVTVLADLYPVPTVLLARFVLRERLSPVQFGGVALALAASALFALA